MDSEELLNEAYEAQREEIESERNRPREEFEKDLLYCAMFDKPNYDRLVLRLSLSALLDIREQNARIIELLSQGALSDISQSVKMRDIANNEIAAVMLGATRNA